MRDLTSVQEAFMWFLTADNKKKGREKKGGRRFHGLSQRAPLSNRT